MLLTSDGRRAGTVSGGCLEAQVAKRAWWLTASGPVIQRQSTLEEDGDLPYGSGCGGIIYLLLERRATAAPLLHALEQAFEQRIPIAVANLLEGPLLGLRAFAGFSNAAPGISECMDTEESHPGAVPPELQAFAESALERGTTIEKKVAIDGTELRAWVNWRAPRPGLWIFGAGDDAHPLLALARELGWFVVVADGRSHLATRERFPAAHEVHALSLPEFPPAQSVNQAASQPSPLTNLRSHDAAVLMTHSFEQDSRILASLLALGTPPSYIGVLGPQRRTRELLAEAARLLNLPVTVAQIEHWLARLYAPMGLDLGAESPETIALSVIAEIQRSLTAATALPLRQVRAATLSAKS
jgi:xanthine/CO dehydrogenase XdhC/CoxF family maturation factor